MCPYSRGHKNGNLFFFPTLSFFKFNLFLRQGLDMYVVQTGLLVLLPPSLCWLTGVCHARLPFALRSQTEKLIQLLPSYG